jgi:hypothetical protein
MAMGAWQVPVGWAAVCSGCASAAVGATCHPAAATRVQGKAHGGLASLYVAAASFTEYLHEELVITHLQDDINRSAADMWLRGTEVHVVLRCTQLTQLSPVRSASAPAAQS